jgi:hypothetical protein
MKKKLLVGIFTGSLILGVTTLTFAQTEDDGLKLFEQMKPHIEKMHPTLTEEEQKEMFNACHGEGGMMEKYNKDNPSNMMNKF